MEKSKGIVRILTIVSIVVTLCIFTIYGVSGYTLGASLTESFMGFFEESPEGETPPGMQMSGDPSTGITLTLSFTAQNPGLLEVSVTLNLKILSVDGEVIAEGVGSKRIPPGLSDELVASLHIPPDKAETYLVPESHDLVLSIFFECRTLFDLVGIAVSAEIGVEAPPPGP